MKIARVWKDCILGNIGICLLILGLLTVSGWAYPSTNIPTNMDVRMDILEGNVGFLNEFILQISMKNLADIVSLDVTNFDFAKVSIDVSTESIQSNTAVLRIKTYELSNFTLPAFLMRTLNDGSTNTFYTPPMEIGVSNLNVYISNISPIEDIYDIIDWTLWIVLAATLIVAGIILWFLLARKSKVFTHTESADSQSDPYEEALSSLHALLHQAVDDQNYKEYFVQISEIDRRFIERVFGIIALEMTTSEIQSALKRLYKEVSEDKRASYDEINEIMEHIFKLCDRVKFAKHVPSNEQVQTVMTESFTLVQKTKELMSPAETLSETDKDYSEEKIP